jgi:hypothetical protein
VFPEIRDNVAHRADLVDAANDCVALAALFRKHAASVRGKTVVTAANVKESAELGTRLLGLLKPAAARNANKTAKSKEIVDAVDARDRLWSLATEGHDVLWRAGAYLFGRGEVDARVPALQARVRGARKTGGRGGGRGAGRGERRRVTVGQRGSPP